MSLDDFIIKPTFEHFISGVGTKVGFAPNLYYALLFFNPKLSIEISDIVKLQSNYTKEFYDVFYAIYLCFCLYKKIPAAEISTNINQMTQWTRNKVTTTLFNSSITHFDDLVIFKPFSGDNYKKRFSPSLMLDKDFINNTVLPHLEKGYAVATYHTFLYSSRAIWKFPMTIQN